MVALTDAAIYARVSTTDQDESRQIQDCREALDDHPYEITDVRVYADVMAGTTTARDDYIRLIDDIEAGEIDLVIATEVSRLSRSGAQDVMTFISKALENGTSVEFTQSPVSLRTEMDEITQSIQRTIISLLSELANVEHAQKMSRIESGIKAAQNAGKWTGRAPRGFTIEDGILHVDTSAFLETRAALERVVAGEPIVDVEESTGIPESTLRHIRDERLDLYFDGDADDDRVDAALDDVRPLPDVDDGRDDQDVDELVERIAALEQAVDDDQDDAAETETS